MFQSFLFNLLENFWKTVKDPPFGYLSESTLLQNSFYGEMYAAYCQTMSEHLKIYCHIEVFVITRVFWFSACNYSAMFLPNTFEACDFCHNCPSQINQWSTSLTSKIDH